MTASERKWIDGIVLEMRAVEKRHLARIVELERRVDALERRKQPIDARSPYDLEAMKFGK